MANTPAVTTNPSKTAKAPGQDRLVCSLCNKVYRSSAGLRYHKRKRHRGTNFVDHYLYVSRFPHSDEGMLKPSQLHRVRCLEAGCNYQMLAISDLRNHLANHHLKPAYKTTEEKKFNSFVGKTAGHHLVLRLNRFSSLHSEFTEWKAEFEQSSGSKYVKNCGSKGKSENQTTEYYYCNRTGLCTYLRGPCQFVRIVLSSLLDKQTRQGWRRNSKTLDSLRCGIHCTSSMKVDIARNDQVSVQYYPTHYGHTAEPPLQVPPILVNSGSTLVTSNVEQVTSVQPQTIPSIQTVVHSTIHQQAPSLSASTDHCVRLQHQHHGQTTSIIINIAPVSSSSPWNPAQSRCSSSSFAGEYNDHQMRVMIPECVFFVCIFNLHI